jgi:acetyl esterase/lipase
MGNQPESRSHAAERIGADLAPPYPLCAFAVNGRPAVFTKPERVPPPWSALAKRGCVVALALTVCAPSPARGAQKFIGSGDLSSLTAPPPDHRLSYGSAPLQFGHLRLPKRGGPHAVVVFVHGGCWSSRFDIAHAAALEQAIADSGFAVWSIEYRRVGDEGGGWPSTFLDVGKAADHLREIAARYELDLDRVITVGHSAGGHFAVWLAARKKIPASSELYVANPLAVHGVVGLAPVPDIEGVYAAGACGRVMDGLLGGSPAERAERYAAASPMQLVPLGVPQVHVVGAHDRTWAPFGRAYVARAKAAGETRITLIEAPESGHFEVIAPATTTWPLVIRELKTVFESIPR